MRTVAAIRPLILCVTEGEADAYAERYGGDDGVSIEPHPDDVKGYCPTKQWIWDRYEYRVVVLDDDITHMRRMYDPDQKPTIDSATSYEVVQATAFTAGEAGAFLFGWANYTMSYAYDVFQPFRTVGYINGMSQGVLPGFKVRLPDDAHFFGSDYYWSALNAYHHRYAWQDTRFGFYQRATFRNPGGQSHFRTLDRERQSFEQLQKLFGTSVVRLKGHRGGRPPSTKASRKEENAGHPYEKVLSIPWS